MNERVLMVATVPSMIGQFNMNNIKMLQEMGYVVDVAGDFTDTSVWPMERVQMFKEQMQDMGIECIQLDFSRSALKLNKHIESYKETIKLIEERRYTFIHTHTPIASAIVRQAAHKTGTKVIYTAHGFHFYDGAPLKNWIIFYPIEKHYSRYTDVLITINKEDYKRAVEKFHAKKTVYVPGVGVDTEKFAPRQSGRERIRTELRIPDDNIVLLSVGELNENKNHISVVQALAGINNVTYVIVGKGDKKEEIETIAAECNVNLILPGFRTDVADFYDAADVYILPSIREGLNVSLMEAMASGLPCLCGRIRGNVDLVDEGNGGFLFPPEDADEIRDAIQKMIKVPLNERAKQGRYNLEKIRSFDLSTVEGITSDIYRVGYEHLKEVLQRQEKRREIGVPLDCKLLLSVGELSIRKNHRVVVEALQSLPDDYWYVIVGKGDLKDELEKLDSTGRLKLLGFRTDIVDILHVSDLFVFPSLQEGLPVALMEAMASGLPVVCSRIRGNTDLTQGNNNCLCEPNDSYGFKKQILKCLTSSKMKHATNNSEVLKTFARESVLASMQEIYSL